jgi:carbamoyl-phosphate synthase small subunit
VVAIDYGAKDNIFRNLVNAGASGDWCPRKPRWTRFWRSSPMACSSERPGDPAATGVYVPVIRGVLDAGSGLRHLPWPPDAGAGAGARPSRCIRATAAPTIRSSALAEGVVEITSMNHGFAVDAATLPEGVVPPLAVRWQQRGIEITGKKAFSVIPP